MNTKHLKSLLGCLAALCLVEAAAFGQAKITTKKYKLADFPTKTTRVVLTGNSVTDEILKKEVSRRWRVSPYEFCSVAEYEASKTSTSYYFLVPMQETFRDGCPGITYMTVMKGGKASSENPDEKSIEVVNFPYYGTDSMGGREMYFTPAMLDIIQTYISDACASPKATAMGLKVYNRASFKKIGKTAYISEDDLAGDASSVSEARGVKVVSEEEANSVIQEGRKGALVTYVVAPDGLHPGACCYDMVISADTHELVYFYKHKLSGKIGPGFSAAELRWFTK